MDLENVLASLVVPTDARILTGMGNSEDAAIVRFPEGKALVQTLDFFTPIVNDPFRFGQIAAANSLSDVYAMGGRPYTVMNIVCFPIDCMEINVLRDILRGGLDKIQESGAFLVGGHSVRDKEIKYGLSVSGLVDPVQYASNTGLRPGDELILTKPLGSGVLATAIKAEWENFTEYEDEIYRWAAHLNRVPGEAIERFHLRGATDITGFGLIGHALEMARASRCSIRLEAAEIPLLRGALELAGLGLVPAGSHANRKFCEREVLLPENFDPSLRDLLFDAQTSGGMLLAVPAAQCAQVCSWMAERGELAARIGAVFPERTDGKRVVVC